MLRTLNYTGRSKITKDEVVIKLEEIPGQPLSFDADFKFLSRPEKNRFPEDSHIYVEAYYKETLQRFDFGTVGAMRRPPNRVLDSVDLTGTTLFRVRVVDESGHIGRLLGAAEALRPEGGEDDSNSESLMILKTKDLVAVPWKVEVVTDGSKPILYLNNRIPDALTRAKSDPGFYSLIMPGALQQVLHRLILDDPDEDDADAVAMRSRWIQMATELESAPPDSEDPEELLSWVDRVIESFCARMDLTGVLNTHLEESGK